MTTLAAPATLTVAQVASALGVSRDAVYAAVHRNEIPNVGLGRTVRIPAGWLERRFANAGQPLDLTGGTFT